MEPRKTCRMITVRVLSEVDVEDSNRLINGFQAEVSKTDGPYCLVLDLANFNGIPGVDLMNTAAEIFTRNEVLVTEKFLGTICRIPEAYPCATLHAAFECIYKPIRPVLVTAVGDTKGESSFLKEHMLKYTQGMQAKQPREPKTSIKL